MRLKTSSRESSALIDAAKLGGSPQELKEPVQSNLKLQGDDTRLAAAAKAAKVEVGDERRTAPRLESTKSETNAQQGNKARAKGKSRVLVGKQDLLEFVHCSVPIGKRAFCIIARERGSAMRGAKSRLFPVYSLSLQAIYDVDELSDFLLQQTNFPQTATINGIGAMSGDSSFQPSMRRSQQQSGFAQQAQLGEQIRSRAGRSGDAATIASRNKVARVGDFFEQGKSAFLMADFGALLSSRRRAKTKT